MERLQFRAGNEQARDPDQRLLSDEELEAAVE
jgi:hypothetical protein